VNPAEEQARRDYEASVRAGREREERQRAQDEARALERRKIEEANRAAREEEFRLRAQRARQNPF
jgi:hypothetical protein